MRLKSKLHGKRGVNRNHKKEGGGVGAVTAWAGGLVIEKKCPRCISQK